MILHTRLPRPAFLARSAALLGLLLAAAAPTRAQDPSLHARLVGRFSQSGGIYADVWSDGDVAYLAHYNQNLVDLVDLSNPASPTLLSTYVVPAPDTGASAQDVKVAQGLMFVALEQSASNGVAIVDVRDPKQPKTLTVIDANPGAFEQIHNLWYDQGWLYLCNSRDNQVAIIDLRSYDPDNAPASISSIAYLMTNVGTNFVHDVVVRGGKLFCAAWDSLEVYDVTRLGSQPPQHLGSVLGLNCHAVWPTDDGAFVVTTEERQGGVVRLFEMQDFGTSVKLVQRDSFALSSGTTYSAHNPLMIGDRVYLSFYEAGLQVLEIDRSTKTWERVASYDTSTVVPTGFAGAWGVYPFRGADQVLISDLEQGLFVIDASGVQISFPSAPPTVVQSHGTQTITVDASSTGTRTVDPSTATLHASVDGAAPTATPMGLVGPSRFAADLPAAPCGARIDWWVSVDDTLGETYTDPAVAPASTHTSYATGALATAFADDFELDKGWGVQNQSLAAGAWVRVDPNGTGAQPEDDDPEGTGTLCFVTGQGSVSGGIGDQDVDGGPTRLISPLFAMSGDGLISTTRWFYDSTLDDSLQVELSSDGGASWAPVETVDLQAGGWRRDVFRVSDVLAPSSTMRLRFSATDNPNNSICEAGLDSVLVQTFTCLPAASSVTRNGSGVNPLGYKELTPPALGTTWRTSVDIVTPGAVASVLAGVATGPLQLPSPFGELLIDFTAPFVLPVNIAAGSHAIPIPPDTGLLGLTLYTQAATYRPQQIRLQNAIDITFGY